MAFCVENKQQTKLWQIAAWQLDYCRNNEKFPVYSLEQINEMYEFKKSNFIIKILKNLLIQI